MKDREMLKNEQQERLEQAEQRVMKLKSRTHHPQEQQPVDHKKGNPPKFRNALDRISRRERRNPYRQKYRNDRKPVGSGFIQMGGAWDDRVIFSPRRKKYKGWQREHFRKTGQKRVA